MDAGNKTGFHFHMAFTKHIQLQVSVLIISGLCAIQSSAFAEPMGAEQATQLLARSQAVEIKCKFLSVSQREELSAFVAKAEVAMVAKSSVAKTKSILVSGRAQASGVTCSDTEKTDIVNILNAANQATSVKPLMVAQPTKPTALTEKLAIKTVFTLIIYFNEIEKNLCKNIILQI